MQRFAALGVNVAVTELDDRIQLPATSADLAPSRPPTTPPWSRTAWPSVGLRRSTSSGASATPIPWIPSAFPGYGAATMYDSNYQPKPAPSPRSSTRSPPPGRR